MASAPVPTRRRLPIGPILLILIGGLLLLNNLGLLSPDVWPTVIKLWPLVLVLLGLQALLTGRVDWGSLVALLAVFALLALATHLTLPRPQPAPTVAPPSNFFRHDLQGAERAIVRVKFGGGQLRIESNGEGGLLALGGRSGDNPARLNSEYHVRDGVGTLEVYPQTGPAQIPFLHLGGQPGSQLSLSLTPRIPLDLDVQAGGAEASLDLSGLNVPSLSYETGATRSTIVLPAAGMTHVNIQAGAAVLNIEVPPGVGARIQTSGSGLSQLEVDQSRFPLVGDAYESRDYPTATNRADLTLRTGLAQVQIR